MKVSLKWLQTYFDTPLPGAEAISDAYTFHAFEIDEMQGDMLDVKVLPNRAADCLCHRGLAKELGAILDLPLKSDPLRIELPMYDLGGPTSLVVEIEDSKKCARYMGALVKGVKVRPSPDWLREALEAVGQRSINNVVDATNYVMLNVGQPLHAFDAAKLSQKDGAYAIGVRMAKEGEKITTLSGETYELSPNIQLITDANTDKPIALAGIKGGSAAELTGETTDLIVESANFDGTTTRRAAQALKLFTDASLRFQNRPSPELAAYGMRGVLALITDIAGGEVVGVVDEYPARATAPSPVSVSLEKINGVLGSNFSRDEVENVFKRLALPYMVVHDVFTVTPPFERTDLTIAEDLVEEVGRIIGYDKVPATELPPLSSTPDQARYRGIERMKDQLVEQGFIEVSTQSFAKAGDVTLANPLDKNMPALRTSLEGNLQDALARAKYAAPLVLAPGQKPKLFEVGTVFAKEGEHIELRMTERVPEWGESAGTVDNLSVAKLEDYGKEYLPARYELGAYKTFSIYPFITRDIAFWAPAGTDVGRTTSYIQEKAGELLVRLDQFDHFEKEGRVSYAFRLVFQSMERTLTDEEINGVMAGIAGALQGAGYEVR
ncbi:MAG: phenylalanine--tRNA ligase subunit beta [Candidatus Paceibacterota bacterium]|jgi:phenylalanyl-tRNA synthetase beta chain